MVAQPPTDDLIAEKRQERLRNFNWRRDYYEVQGAYHMTIIKWTLSIQVFVIKMECFLVSIYRQISRLVHDGIYETIWLIHCFILLKYTKQ